MTPCPPYVDSDLLPPLWVLRHGETEWNVEGRLQGRLDSALTPLGMQQARDQADILAKLRLPKDFDLVCSPSGRTVATAQLVAERLSATLEQDDDLVEVGLGEWQGQLVRDIPQGLMGHAERADPHLWKFSGPGCESLQQMVARVTRFVMARQRPAVVVTHGVTSRVLRCVALGLLPERLSHLPGGQGVVHHVEGGRGQTLRLKPDHTINSQAYDPQC